MTEAEKILWEKLKSGGFQKYKFRRQHPIQRFIVDFYSHKLRLVIEVDGNYHEVDDQKKKDEERTELLEFQDLEIFRITNDEIFQDVEGVLELIKRKIYTLEHKTFPDSL